MADVLLQTKLYRPTRSLAQRPFLVPRSHLSHKLQSGLSGKMTLVSAPAGFGKTTMVAAWLDELAKKQIGIGWLSLDEIDNDLVRFLAYLVAALQTAMPDIGEAAGHLLQSPPPPPAETILTLLINDISQNDQPLILVLDDYHVITIPAIHQALTFLLDHLPSQLHLLLTTRSDPPLPLSRLRARGQVMEIRANDLRFTFDETRLFFSQVMGLTLSNEQLAALEQRTEGWIAGLQLAGLSMQGYDDLSGFIAALTGSNRFILDYLTDEVLEQRPKGTKNFLLQTSILNRLCGPLCDALTGESDGQATLERLEQANLFLIPLDEERHWYRYHHLFAEVLHQRLRQAQLGLMEELHRRAFAWYAKEGLIDDALGHSLAAGELAPALALVEKHAWPSLERGEYFTIRAWLDRLSAAHLHSQPGLTLIYGSVLAMTGKVDEGERLLQDTAALWAVPDLPLWQRGELAHLRAILARLRANMAASKQLAKEALVYLPAERPARRGAALVNLMMVAIVEGDAAVVEDALAQLAELSTAHHKTTQLNVMHGIAWMYTRRGQLARAAQLQRQVLREAEELQANRFVALGFAHTGLGKILYEQNDLSSAIEHLSQGIAYLRNSIEQIVMATSCFALARARLADGDFQGLAVLDEADAWMTEMHLDNLGFMRVMAAQRALIALQLGNLDSARQWMAASDLPPVTEMPFYRYQEYLLMARVHLAQRHPQKALPILDAVEVGTTTRQMSGQLILIHCLRALALQACGDAATALDFLTQALTLAEPEGYVRLFVDEGAAMIALLRQARQRGLFPNYIDKLLAAFPATESTPGAADLLPEPLSEREREVLQLVATGASNRDIAGQLFIALSTVKKHMGNILVKLDTPNRVQAIARARELGLLS